MEHKELLFDCGIGWLDKSAISACLPHHTHDETTILKNYVWTRKPYGIVRLCQWQIVNAFDLGWTQYGDDRLILCNTLPELPMVIELPCRQCSKMNDVGKPICWWCTCPNPN